MDAYRDAATAGPRAGEGGLAPVNYDLVRALQRRVADRLTALRQDQAAQGTPELSAEDEQQVTLDLIREEVAAHMRTQLSAHQQLPDPGVDVQLARAVESAIFGAGVLQELLDNPWIENIDINGCDEVWLTYADDRGKVPGPPVAGSDEDLIEVVRTLAAYAGLNPRPFSPANPQLDLRLGDGSRLSAGMSFTERPTVSIRRHRLEQTFLARVPPAAQTRSVRGRAGGSGPAATLLQLGTVDEQLAAFLEAAVRARANIMIAGATDAGKTTLLRALIHCIPAHERLVTVEKALELGLRRHRYLHPDTVEMEVVLPGPDGSGGVDIGELVRRSLRMNPSRVIVGEVLGPEVVDMLYAMTQGNDGSLSTIHSRTAEDVFFRLGTLAGDYGNKAFPIAQAMISRAIDFVVFVRKNSRQDGRRVVSEVLEVSGSPDGRVASARIFAEDAYGRAQRVLDVPIMRAQQLAEHGYHETGFDPFWSMDDPRPTGDPGIPAYRDELSAQPWSSTLRPWER